MSLPKLALLLALAMTGGAATTGRIRVDEASGFFVDASGRARIFHGVNAVQKAFPWHPSVDAFDPSSSLVAEDIANLKGWGFNAVRLGVMWAGVEPVQSQYNETCVVSLVVSRLRLDLVCERASRRAQPRLRPRVVSPTCLKLVCARSLLVARSLAPASSRAAGTWR